MSERGAPGACGGAAGSVSKLRRLLLGHGGAHGRRRLSTGPFLSAGLAVLLVAAFAFAQRISPHELNFYTRPYRPPINTRTPRGVKLVEANVVVRNAKGDLVAGLKQGDFKIYDNGKQQTITQFAVSSAKPGAATDQAAPPSSPAAANTSSPSAVTATPRFIALLFDDRSSSFEYFSYAQLAAEKFVREGVRPGDKVGIFTASNTYTLNFTGDKAKLLKTIESMRVVPYAWPKAPGCPGSPQQLFPMGPYAAYLVAAKGDQQALNFFSCGGTGGVQSAVGGLGPEPTNQSPSASRLSISPQSSASQSATLTVAQGILSTWEKMTGSLLGSLENVIGRLAQKPGQRVVVLISSGFLSAPLKPALDQVASDALRNRIVVNAINARGVSAPGTHSESNASDPLADSSSNPYLNQLLHQQQIQLAAGMGTLAVDTGGVFFDNRNDLRGGLQEMAKVPAVSYRLGFVPSKLKNNGRFHRLRVEVTKLGSFQVRTRKGYYAPPKHSRQPKAKLAKLTQQVLKTDEINGFRAQVGAQAGRLPSGETGMAISMRVDPRSLSFKKVHGRHRDTLNLIVALFSSAGQFVTGERGVVDMNLKGSSLAGLESHGLNPRIVLKAAPGKYRLRVVMEDTGNGKMFATARSVSIP